MTTLLQHDTIAVVDFGGQYAHLIANKVRRLNVYAEIRQPDDPVESFKKYKGIILSGSPALASDGEDEMFNSAVFGLDIPILGFCFGHQSIAKFYGGKVENTGNEWGHADLHITRDHPIFNGLSKKEIVWMSHNDTVTAIGPDFFELGYTVLKTDSGEEIKQGNAAIGSDKYRRYGFQYHPEVDDTVNGDKMIDNFIKKICECKPSWNMDAFLEQELEKIRQQVGDRSVFLLASGGVDSTVAAKMFAEALGPDRLYLLHVDNGMMRKNESVQVLEMLKILGVDKHLHFVDATDTFVKALDGVTEPEKKRGIIGNVFIDVFQSEAQRLGIEKHLLGQGTIYPDTIETKGTKRADLIKTHHNRVPIIDKMISEGKVIEPLVELYKVEVRELAEKLGVPHDMIWRHPFPGPGLGVRLLCFDGISHHNNETFQLIQSKVSTIVGSFQSISVMVLPIKSVGVKADLRCYEHPVLLSGSRDWDQLLMIAEKLLREVKGINRIVWNLSSDIPTSAAPLAGYMTKQRLDLLRDADHIMMSALRQHNIYDSVWQCPIAAVPMSLDSKAGELIVLRPVHSLRAMSAKPAQLPQPLLDEVCGEILRLPGVCGVCFDLTSKPPGTIEWE